MNKHFRRVLPALVVVGALLIPAVAFADDAGTIDYSQAGTIVTGAAGSLTPVLLLVAAAGAGLALLMWGIPKAIKFFKRVAS
jgi:hypothetical protein